MRRRWTNPLTLLPSKNTLDKKLQWAIFYYACGNEEQSWFELLLREAGMPLEKY